MALNVDKAIEHLANDATVSLNALSAQYQTDLAQAFDKLVRQPIQLLRHHQEGVARWAGVQLRYVGAVQTPCHAPLRAATHYLREVLFAKLAAKFDGGTVCLIGSSLEELDLFENRVPNCRFSAVVFADGPRDNERIVTQTLSKSPNAPSLRNAINGAVFGKIYLWRDGIGHIPRADVYVAIDSVLNYNAKAFLKAVVWPRNAPLYAVHHGAAELFELPEGRDLWHQDLYYRWRLEDGLAHMWYGTESPYVHRHLKSWSHVPSGYSRSREAGGSGYALHVYAVEPHAAPSAPFWHFRDVIRVLVAGEFLRYGVKRPLYVKQDLMDAFVNFVDQTMAQANKPFELTSAYSWVRSRASTVNFSKGSTQLDYTGWTVTEFVEAGLLEATVRLPHVRRILSMAYRLPVRETWAQWWKWKVDDAARQLMAPFASPDFCDVIERYHALPFDRVRDAAAAFIRPVARVAPVQPTVYELALYEYATRTVPGTKAPYGSTCEAKFAAWCRTVYGPVICVGAQPGGMTYSDGLGKPWLPWRKMDRLAVLEDSLIRYSAHDAHAVVSGSTPVTVDGVRWPGFEWLVQPVGDDAPSPAYASWASDVFAGSLEPVAGNHYASAIFNESGTDTRLVGSVLDAITLDPARTGFSDTCCCCGFHWAIAETGPGRGLVPCVHQLALLRRFVGECVDARRRWFVKLNTPHAWWYLRLALADAALGGGAVPVVRQFEQTVGSTEVLVELDASSDLLYRDLGAMLVTRMIFFGVFSALTASVASMLAVSRWWTHLLVFALCLTYAPSPRWPDFTAFWTVRPSGVALYGVRAGLAVGAIASALHWPLLAFWLLLLTRAGPYFAEALIWLVAIFLYVRAASAVSASIEEAFTRVDRFRHYLGGRATFRDFQLWFGRWRGVDLERGRVGQDYDQKFCQDASRAKNDIDYNELDRVEALYDNGGDAAALYRGDAPAAGPTLPPTSPDPPPAPTAPPVPDDSLGALSADAAIVPGEIIALDNPVDQGGVDADEEVLLRAIGGAEESSDDELPDDDRSSVGSGAGSATLSDGESSEPDAPQDVTQDMSVSDDAASTSADDGEPTYPKTTEEISGDLVGLRATLAELKAAVVKPAVIIVPPVPPGLVAAPVLLTADQQVLRVSPGVFTAFLKLVPRQDCHAHTWVLPEHLIGEERERLLGCLNQVAGRPRALFYHDSKRPPLIPPDCPTFVVAPGPLPAYAAAVTVVRVAHWLIWYWTPALTPSPIMTMPGGFGECLRSAISYCVRGDGVGAQYDAKIAAIGPATLDKVCEVAKSFGVAVVSSTGAQLLGGEPGRLGAILLNADGTHVDVLPEPGGPLDLPIPVQTEPSLVAVLAASVPVVWYPHTRAQLCAAMKDLFNRKEYLSSPDNADWGAQAAYKALDKTAAQQMEVLKSTRPLAHCQPRRTSLVVAGPGSGKTRLAAKFAYQCYLKYGDHRTVFITTGAGARLEFVRYYAELVGTPDMTDTGPQVYAKTYIVGFKTDATGRTNVTNFPSDIKLVLVDELPTFPTHFIAAYTELYGSVGNIVCFGDPDQMVLDVNRQFNTTIDAISACVLDNPAWPALLNSAVHLEGTRRYGQCMATALVRLCSPKSPGSTRSLIRSGTAVHVFTRSAFLALPPEVRARVGCIGPRNPANDSGDFTWPAYVSAYQAQGTTSEYTGWIIDETFIRMFSSPHDVHGAVYVAGSRNRHGIVLIYEPKLTPRQRLLDAVLRPLCHALSREVRGEYIQLVDRGDHLATPFLEMFHPVPRTATSFWHEPIIRPRLPYPVQFSFAALEQPDALANGNLLQHFSNVPVPHHDTEMQVSHAGFAGKIKSLLLVTDSVPANRRTQDVFEHLVGTIADRQIASRVARQLQGRYQPYKMSVVRESFQRNWIVPERLAAYLDRDLQQEFESAEAYNEWYRAVKPWLVQDELLTVRDLDRVTSMLGRAHEKAQAKAKDVESTLVEKAGQPIIALSKAFNLLFSFVIRLLLKYFWTLIADDVIIANRGNPATYAVKWSKLGEIFPFIIEGDFPQFDASQSSATHSGVVQAWNLVNSDPGALGEYYDYINGAVVISQHMRFRSAGQTLSGSPTTFDENTVQNMVVTGLMGDCGPIGNRWRQHVIRIMFGSDDTITATNVHPSRMFDFTWCSRAFPAPYKYKVRVNTSVGEFFKHIVGNGVAGYDSRIATAKVLCKNYVQVVRDSSEWREFQLGWKDVVNTWLTDFGLAVNNEAEYCEEDPDRVARRMENLIGFSRLSLPAALRELPLREYAVWFDPDALRRGSGF